MKLDAPGVASRNSPARSIIFIPSKPAKFNFITGSTVPPQFNSYAVVTTMIALVFDGRSTKVIKVTVT